MNFSTFGDHTCGDVGAPCVGHGVVSTYLADLFTFLIQGLKSICSVNTWRTLTFDGAAR